MIAAILVMQAATLGILAWGVIGNWLDARRRRREAEEAYQAMREALDLAASFTRPTTAGRLTNQEPS